MKLICGISSLLLTIFSANGATLTAASAAYTDVNAVCNGSATPDSKGVIWSTSTTQDATHKTQAQDGDLVIIPNGDVAWDGGAERLLIQRNIVIQGSGATNITVGTPLGTDDGKFRIGMRVIDQQKTGVQRITEINFYDAAKGSDVATKRRAIAIRLAGAPVSTNKFLPRRRVDHCYFEGFNRAIETWGAFGVTDHNVYLDVGLLWYHTSGGGTLTEAMMGLRSTFKNASDKFMFHEDETATYTSETLAGNTSATTAIADNQTQTNPWVIRHCTFTMGGSIGFFPLFDAHGDSGCKSQYSPGNLIIMVYANTFYLSPGTNSSFVDLRGGSAWIWNNKFYDNTGVYHSFPVGLREEFYEDSRGKGGAASAWNSSDEPCDLITDTHSWNNLRTADNGTTWETVGEYKIGGNATNVARVTDPVGQVITDVSVLGVTHFKTAPLNFSSSSYYTYPHPLTALP